MDLYAAQVPHVEETCHLGATELLGAIICDFFVSTKVLENFFVDVVDDAFGVMRTQGKSPHIRGRIVRTHENILKTVGWWHMHNVDAE
jgi:hypothetical protein